MTNSEKQEALKIMKEYRIEAREECKGCLSINTSYPLPSSGWRRLPDREYIDKECKFTQSGFPDIPNCPCKTCLIKCTCNYMCKDFVTQAKGYKRCMHYTIDLNINGPKKYYAGPR
jgi:hypothetical protein